MPNIILVYASMSGNTEEMAQAVAEGARNAGASVDIRECMSASADELTNFDGVLLGSYSWGEGELPDELLDFADDLDELDLSGKRRQYLDLVIPAMKFLAEQWTFYLRN